jgi:DNA-directed RNA polymerase subunit RPC12/RpoP
MDIKCVKCGRELEVPEHMIGRQGQCPFCSAIFFCGEEQTAVPAAHSEVPPEVMRWNWGAFFWTWIWSIFNGVWIGLLALLPFLNIIMVFVLGAKGSEWAWKTGRWQSVAHFKRVQKKWSIAGLIMVLLTLAYFVLTVVFGLELVEIENLTAG